MENDEIKEPEEDSLPPESESKALAARRLLGWRLIEKLCVLTAGGPSMCDELLEERRRERERELAEEGW
ncbi:MAG: hypothetical protein ABSG60_04300 [Terracidiphilus sp.]|jgi:hypothetical protein